MLNESLIAKNKYKEAMEFIREISDDIGTKEKEMNVYISKVNIQNQHLRDLLSINIKEEVKLNKYLDNITKV